MHKIMNQSKLKTGECGFSEKQRLKHVNNKFTNKRLNGHRYKEIIRLSARKARASAHKMLGRTEEQSQEGHEVNCCKEVDKDVAVSPIICSEGHREDFNVTQEDFNVESENERRSSPVGGSKGQAQKGKQLTADIAGDAKSVKPQSAVVNESYCAICKLGGKLLCCSGQGCRKSFHLTCVDPPLTFAPPGIWHCSWCTRKKIKFGVHSVSQGIESIWDCREALLNNRVMCKQKEYLVKYKSLAHVHNRWISESQLRYEAPIVFEKDKWKKSKWKAEWSVPHRLVKRRLIISPGHCSDYDSEDSDCEYEWLVKWRGLNYDHCTWELENASFMKTPQAMLLIKNFESRRQNSYITTDPSTKDEEMKSNPVQLSEFPFEVSPGIHDFNLMYVNSLRGYWSRSRNAVVFDEDRVEKVVLFVLSLQYHSTQPVLIITSYNTIAMWEAEFSRYSSFANVVTYNGNRDVRATIRTLEFYDENGRVAFQALLSTPDAVVEDLELLDHIKWEAIVIDECERPVISRHFVQLKILAADMKLLLFSGEMLDKRFNYHNLLSLIDPEFNEVNEDIALEPNIGIRKLKEQLAEFIAYECKFEAPIFSEYWVPVRLSSIQIEQYCDLLQSKSRLLCSSLKNDASHPLRELLSLTQKCCDHPYLVDHSLRSSVTKDLHLDDYLNAEINASGKLQLLDMILSEVKKGGLKVLVLFQSVVASGKICIGDILDDLVHRRFGEDYYVRIEGEMTPPGRQVALDMFNNKESTSFICLMDYRACVSTITLSSLDIVILFNSDMNPLNDIRSLQKITIDPQSEQIKLFRLYSCFTLEEKSLILAKQGITLGSKSHRINRISCHMLLAWGASFLCNKSNDLNTHFSSAKSFLDDVLFDFRAQLSENGDDDMDSNGSSIILKLTKMEGTYPSDITLPSEVGTPWSDIFDIDAPHLFWRNMLEERHDPKLKHLYTPSRRVQKKPLLQDDSVEVFESQSAECEQRKGVNSIIRKKRSKNKRKRITDLERSLSMGPSRLSSGKRSKHSSNPSTGTYLSRMVSVDERRDDVSSNGHITEQHEVTQQSNQNLPSREIHSCRDQVREQLNDSTELTTMSPPSSQQQSMYANVIRSEPDTSLQNTNVARESQIGRPPHTIAPELTNSSSTDPLQREMESIQKDIDKATKTHQEMQWRLNLECEKEVAAIREKYDVLIKESKKGMVEQMESLERKYKIVHDSKLLAEALAKKCNTAEEVFSDTTQEATIYRFVDDILQFCPQSTFQSSNMTHQPVGPTAQLVNQTMGAIAPSQVMNFPQCPSAAPMISPIEARQLSMPSINSYGNSLASRNVLFQAPAPHLRNSTTLSFGSPPCLSLPSIPEPPTDMNDGVIYSLPPLDVDFSTLYSVQNPGSNYRAI